MELTTGVWTNEMLAEWFNISAGTLKNTKKKRLEELKEYADFYEKKGKVVITEVKIQAERSLKKAEVVEQILELNWETFLAENPQLTLIKDQIVEFWKRYEAGYSPATLFRQTAAWRVKKYGAAVPQKKYSSVPIRRVEEEIKEDNAYIYAFVQDGEIVYIGKTKRPIKQRKAEHEAAAALLRDLDNSQQEHLYKSMREKDYDFILLYESHGEISNFQLQCLECGYIKYYRPKFNYEGVVVPYRFEEKKKAISKEDCFTD